MQRETTDPTELQEFKESFFRSQLKKALREAPVELDAYKTGELIPESGYVVVESEDDYRLLFRIFRELLANGGDDPSVLVDTKIEECIQHEREHKEKAQELLKDLAGYIHHYYGIQFFERVGGHIWLPFHKVEHRESLDVFTTEISVAMKEAPSQMSERDRLQAEALRRK